MVPGDGGRGLAGIRVDAGSPTEIDGIPVLSLPVVLVGSSCRRALSRGLEVAAAQPSSELDENNRQ